MRSATTLRGRVFVHEDGHFAVPPVGTPDLFASFHSNLGVSFKSGTELPRGTRSETRHEEVQGSHNHGGSIVHIDHRLAPGVIMHLPRVVGEEGERDERNVSATSDSYSKSGWVIE